MVDRVAERVQPDHRPHPRRLDPAPRAVALLPLDDPALRGPQRVPPQRAVRSLLVAVQAAVEQLERAAPGIARRERGGARPQLLHPERHGCRRAQRRDDREGDDRLPRPAAERVDAERRARREQDQLRWNRGHVVPGPEREQREPHAGEDARPLDAARVAYERGCAAHVSRVGRVAREPQGDVRLDRCREVAVAAVEGRPRPVGALLRANPFRRRRGCSGVVEAEVAAQEEILRVDGHVRLELALPPPVGVLER